jgi:lipopolysaccharide/colanic/teichoic acid biosynthesis glycosyltransferase
MFVNASTGPQAYGLAMRSFRGDRLSRRTYAGVAPDQMRRLADLLIAGALLIITFPLMAFVALAIKWEGPGPIFERQRCIGRGGRRFEMLSFRTMVPEPERTMPVWARKTTHVGEFLRHSRIECLPQLINVLMGEMSIVDPDGNSPSFLE